MVYVGITMLHSHIYPFTNIFCGESDHLYIGPSISFGLCWGGLQNL